MNEEDGNGSHALEALEREMPGQTKKDQNYTVNGMRFNYGLLSYISRQLESYLIDVGYVSSGLYEMVFKCVLLEDQI